MTWRGSIMPFAVVTVMLICLLPVVSRLLLLEFGPACALFFERVRSKINQIDTVSSTFKTRDLEGLFVSYAAITIFFKKGNPEK
jgi:hypothetical protein